MQQYSFLLGGLPLLRPGRSCSINGENRTGEKGGACHADSPLGFSRKGSPCIDCIPSSAVETLMDVKGSGVIQHIWFTVADETDKGRFVLRDLVLRMYWDGEETPSVETPLGDFFLNGFARGYEVSSLPMTVNPRRGMNCFLPMPFSSHARVTVENQHAGDIRGFFFQIDYTLYDEPLPGMGSFHAQWRRQKLTALQEDYVLLDGVRGRGHYIGAHLMIQALERYWWGEGEMKFYIDGDGRYPSQCSTGLEDYFGGAWSFGGYYDEKGHMQEKTYCTPFQGYPFYSCQDTFHAEYFQRDIPPMRSFYRWHIPDPVLFKNDLKVTVQQIGSGPRGPHGLFERQDDYASVCYWYQTEPHAPFPTLPCPEDRWPR